MKPLTSAMYSYRNIVKEFKKMEKIKEDQRKVVLAELKDDPFAEYEGLVYNVQTRTDFKHKAFFDWVAKTWPDKLESLREDKIDYAKFETAFARGEIEYDELPEEVFTTKDIDVITVK